MFGKSNPDELRELSLSILLVFELMTIFVVSPLITISGGEFHWVLDVFLAMMAFVSVFIVARGVWRWLALLSFALCISGLAVGPLLADPKRSAVLSIISGLLFSINVCWVAAHKVFKEGPVTLHRIRGAVVIYLNIALMFALLDSLLASFVKDAYSNLPADTNTTVGTMIYFSLATLTTVGYGDIVPIYPFARSLASLEAVTGQFYVGILIATLVGLHVSHREKKDDRTIH